jgi:dihydroorotate dehydrogenase electron transfer subunit
VTVKDTVTKVKAIRSVAEGVFLLSFDAPLLAKGCKPGQFVDIRVDSPEMNLRRPFCIHHTDGDTVFVLFRIRGRGTEILSQLKKGDDVEVLGPLGNGFPLPKKGTDVLLVAGGMGVAPVFGLAAKIAEKKPAKGEKRRIIVAAKSKSELLCAKDLKSFGFEVIAVTDDGSVGSKGNAVTAFKALVAKETLAPTTLYTCGPEIMFHGLQTAIADLPQISAYASFEQFMGCGIGTCRACVCETKTGYKRVCKDGPVFDLREIQFT